MLIRRRGWILIALALLAATTASLYWISRPARVAHLLLDRIGSALGLEISASGATEYRLRGTPMLVLRNVVAREPGAANPVLRADRIYLTLPWSTIRDRGGDLRVKRVELDRPALDLAALQRWRKSRPPSGETRIPTLTDGLRITDGSLVAGGSGGGWRIDGIGLDLPSLYPDRPLRARVQGRYFDAPLTAPFALAVVLDSPRALLTDATTAFSATGNVSIDRGDWRMPAQITLSGPVRWNAAGLTVTPANFGMAASYDAGQIRVPFALGLHGPLGFQRATWTIAPAGLSLRGRGEISQDPVPTLVAHGALALGQRLALQLDGVIAAWPQAWPALPSPLGQSRSPLPFLLRYDGAPDGSDIAALQLRRDATRFEGRFHLPQVLSWSKAAATGTPLPPIDGRLTTPRVLIAGAMLEGVEIDFEDDAVAPSTR